MSTASAAIFTSIPAKVQRHDRRGVDIGQAYTERCVRSWLEGGHRVISVNTPAEIDQIASRFADVEFRAVERSAVAAVGRPLVYMSDLLNECAVAEADVVGIVNADLFLHAPKSFDRLLARMDGRTLVYAERLDVDDVDDPSEAEPYSAGMDCFLFSPSMVKEIGDENFIFGECWWDYWLPIVLAKRGHRLQLAGPPPFIKHLQHGDGGLGAHAGHYFDGFDSFVRALTVRLPLPGSDPWTIQANACFVGFLRLFNPASEPSERIIYVQFLGHVVRLYLHQEPDLIAAIRQMFADWRFNPAYPVEPRPILDRLYAAAEQAAGALAAAARSAAAGAPL
ncbi:MAG TPA: hypothetical protein VMB81_16340 [Candidatus Sulfotelmatobacter sp.]|nr:hypothetical protein [Candidatus Sulfotelmatobacter sp.]